MGRLYAGVLGPIAFAAILARSLVDGGGVETTLKLATCCLFAFAAIGYVVGCIAESIVNDSVRMRFEQEFQANQKAAARQPAGPSA